ncbi:MAG: hypothetical protein QOK38_3114, partial [Acidobacteriaceae bacterium]|nr:hypothetical protein [Acidobacteriaceae bacterium]
YGQIGTLTAGAGKDCTGASVSVGTVQYGIVGPASDPTHENIDVSPSGQICAGHWNRLTSSGVAPYTTCIPTNVQQVATATASANGVASSNAVQVYIHPVVTSVALDTTGSSGGSPLTSCISQNQTAQLDATAFIAGQSTPYCAPNVSGVPNCSSLLGHLSYAAQSTSSTSGTGSTNSIVSIDQNGLATAQHPGAALISASISGTSSSAGVFHTCPPKSITVTANGNTKVTVTPNTPQPTTATVIDTNGNTITGVPLSYTSTDQRTIGVSGTGSITSTFPGSSSVYAVCAPPTCNPAPVNQIGIEGNGTPIASDTLNVTSPGSASSFLWMASPNSQYFTPLDLSLGTIGTPVHLPYVPNSMVLDQTGSSLYFGSYRELMVVAAATNALIKEDTTVPGVVLAVSPTNNQVLINDRDRQIFYVYQPAVAGSTTTGGTGSAGSTGTPASIVTQYGGVGQRASFSPDGSTLYILGTNKLYVYNSFTGWSTETLDASNGTPVAGCPANGGTGADANTAYNVFCAPDLSLAVPQFGAFLSGQNTTARGYCPDTRLTPIDNYPSAVPAPAAGYNFAADHLASTTDGTHVISATAGPTAQLIDSNVVVPTNAPPPAGETTVSGACPTDPTTKATIPLTITNPANFPQSLAAYAPSLIHQVVTSPNSSLAVVTYDSTSATPGNAVLPVYTIPPTPGSAGTLSSVKLTGAQATTPVAAIFSPDYAEIFVSTAGDGNIHLVSTSTLTDTEQFSANLPDGNGGVTPAQFLAVKPRSIP